MTEIARKELRSYKQLPQIWYQIQTKFRDEPRPKSGLLRVRQFIMKDAYSFDIDADGLDVSYRKHYDTYNAIFTRCGLKFVVVEAHSGAMGGSQSHEFMIYTDAGEDMVASCPKCGYAANLEKAVSRLAPEPDLAATGNGAPELAHTPGKKTIEEVAEYLGVSPRQKIKTLALIATWDGSDGKQEHHPVAVFVRGDHMLNEAKLLATIGAREVRPMHAEEIEAAFKSPAGYLGPVGVSGLHTVVVDKALEGRTNLVSGANKEDYHFRNVTPGRDFEVKEYADVRNVEAGEGCPNCGAPLVVATAVEIGHIFKLGDKYSKSMGARVLDQAGKEVLPIMGCYGIGVERILTSAIEQNHDDDGFWLPRSIAPFDVVVTPTNMSDASLRSAGEEVATRLAGAGFDVLLDDREDRAGVKFKDADLVGIPFRVNVGKKVSEGKVEVIRRSTRELLDASMTEIPEKFAQIARTKSNRAR
jgi:prolyl-tRNA synthetase